MIPRNSNGIPRNCHLILQNCLVYSAESDIILQNCQRNSAESWFIPRNRMWFCRMTTNSVRFRCLFRFINKVFQKTESLGLSIHISSKWSFHTIAEKRIEFFGIRCSPHGRNWTEFSEPSYWIEWFIDLELFLEAVVAGAFGDHLCPHLTSSGSRCTDVFVTFFERNQNGIF